MTQMKSSLRAAPVVQMLMALRQRAEPPKPTHGNRATVEDFERERMGVAGKE